MWLPRRSHVDANWWCKQGVKHAECAPTFVLGVTQHITHVIIVKIDFGTKISLLRATQSQEHSPFISLIFF
jgi:hypothetical protein